MADSRASSALSFTDREGSASPQLSATPARSSFSPSNRSFSASSSVSSYSDVSSGKRSSSFDTTARRRGYVRPQGASFSDSARNRDSVMSLGSIAHLQYYFARTGLLDGKGGQLAKSKKAGGLDIPQLRLSSFGADGDLTQSPTEDSEDLDWDTEPAMLPPTVSTYSHRPIQAPSPPDTKVLKKDLVKALENALHALEATGDYSSDAPEESQGFHEIQGLHLLDVITLAIRAARMYYTNHENPARLAAIKSERVLRSELLSVMDVLKKYATRTFAGGLKEDEKLTVLVWVSDVSQMINTETKVEEAEKKERGSWDWMNDDNDCWKDRERERESRFLNSLLSISNHNLKATPETKISPLQPFSPSPASSAHDPLLSSLWDGRLLIHLHNAAVSLSRRQFGSITLHHTDIKKPYRRAENLRFWIKAAEIRWETRLNLDIMGIVYSSEDPKVWEEFERELLKWCRGVREEIIRDWKVHSSGGKGPASPRNPVTMSMGPTHARNASLETVTPESMAADAARS